MKYISTPLFYLFLLFLSSSMLGQEKYRHIYSAEIYFDPGKFEILPQYQEVLKTVTKFINEEEITKVIIQAHTDSVGTPESNRVLSERRANSLADFLKQVSLKDSLIEIRTYGEFSPIAENATAEGRAKNRRVTVIVLGQYDAERYNVSAKIFGKVSNKKTGLPLANSRILMLYAGRIDTLITDEKGQYSNLIDRRANVEIRADAKNFFFVSKLVYVKGKENIELDFNLEPTILGGKMFLGDLYFRPGTAFLMPASERSLAGVVAFLEYNDQLKIEIGGHINRPNEPPVGPETSSFQLSQDRAKAVYDYLIENKIAASRLQYKGYGNSEMIYPNAETEIQQLMNRRVELKVVE